MTTTGRPIATDLRPNWVSALTDLSWNLATTPERALRDAPRALKLAERASILSKHRDIRALDALAAAGAAVGQFEQARAAIQEAIALDPVGATTSGMLDRQTLYVQRQPCLASVPVAR